VDRRALLSSLPLAAAAVPAAARPSLAGLVTHLTSYPSSASPGGAIEAVDLNTVSSLVSAVRAAYQHSRYRQATEGLVRLLTDLDAAAATFDGDLACRVAALQAEAYQVASGLLLKADDPTLATLAADRSIAAARRSGDPLVAASSIRSVAHALLSCGHAGRSVEVGVTAAQGLRADATDSSAETLSLYGALLLRAAIAAARTGDRDRANILLDEADTAATRLGLDGNACWTAFGPTNVAQHRVAVAVDLGDAGLAVQLATAVPLAKIALPERKASLCIDTARALSQWRKYDRALAAIRTAERFAPEEVRSRRSVHHLIGELARHGPPSVQRQVRQYADSIGAAL